MKRLKNLSLAENARSRFFNASTVLVLLVVFASSIFVISCTKENEPPPAPATNNPIIVRGDAVMLPGNMVAKDSTQWKMDKTHSSVLWQSSYVGASGLLTGRFNHFGIHEVVPAEMITYTTNGQPLKDTSWAFYENDPSKTYFHGYVQINTSNTGEPGRDTGCNIAGMGTVKAVIGTHNLTTTNLASIKTTKVEFDPVSSDYIVTLDLTWQGKLTAPVTKSIIGRLKYVKKSRIEAATPYDVFGLQLSFSFNCRDFGITSTSIADKMDIQVNMNFHNK